MVRILGNNLSNRKKIYIALTAVYGIGISTSQKLLAELNIDPDIKVADFQKAISTLFSRLYLKPMGAIRSCMFNLLFSVVSF